MTSNQPTSHTRVERALTELQDAVAALRASEDEDDDDAAWGMLRDTMSWAVDTDPRVLGGRYGGYLVVLDQRAKDEDAEMLLRLLLRIDGVIAVTPVPEDIQTYFATARMQHRLRDYLSEALDGFFWAPQEPGEPPRSDPGHG